MFETFVDAQSLRGEILLEFVRAYPGLTTGFITVSSLIILGLVAWAFFVSRETPQTKSR